MWLKLHLLSTSSRTQNLRLSRFAFGSKKVVNTSALPGKAPDYGARSLDSILALAVAFVSLRQFFGPLASQGLMKL